MYGVRKQIFEKRRKEKRAKFTSFSEKEGGRYALRGKSVNCDLTGGSVKGGIGLLPYSEEGLSANMPVSTKAVYELALNNGSASDSKGIYLVGSDGGLYRSHLTTGEVTKLVTIGDRLTHTAFRDDSRKTYHLFCGDAKAMITTDGVSFILLGEEAYRGACIVKGRCFFVVAPSILRYSAPMEPMKTEGDSDGGGALFLPTLHGEATGVCAENECLYVFMERGIYRLETAASSRDFQLTQIEYAGGKISRGSMIATGKGIFFLAQEGAYRLQNDRVERVCAWLDIQPIDGECTVGRCEDIVLIEYFAEGGGRKRLAMYTDGADGFFTEPYGALGGGELTYQSSLVFRFAKNSPRTMYRRAAKFSGEPLDLGSAKRKQLRRLRLFGDGEARLGLTVDGFTYSYALTVSGGVSEIPLRMRGRVLKIDLFPSAGACLTGLEIDYAVEEE